MTDNELPAPRDWSRAMTPQRKPGPRPGSTNFSALNGHTPPHPIRFYRSGCPACQKRTRDAKRAKAGTS